VGAQFLRESDVATDYALQSTALATPYYLQAINGERNVAAVYYQVNIPLISTLAFSQSSRYDHYSDFGSAFSPRYALSYKPVTGLTTYASYSRGFRAPTLAETSQQNSSGVQTAVDPNSPTEPTTALNYTVLVGGNTHLQPEHTQNYNLGAQWEPTPATSLGLDLYRIEIKDVIGTPNIQALIDANDPDIVVRNPNGTIAYVNFDYQNLDSLMTDGLELTARQGVTTSAGTFTVSGDWAYVRRFTQTSDGVAIDFAGNDNAIDTPYGASFPRWKGTTSLDWSWHSFDTSVAYQYTGPYAETIMGGHVSSFGQFNLGASYSGFTNLTIYGRINNVLGRFPPYDPLFLQFPSQTPYDPSLYNDQGRYAEVGVRYRFF
jgi:iron complex outermembrane receptor protein